MQSWKDSLLWSLDPKYLAIFKLKSEGYGHSGLYWPLMWSLRYKYILRKESSRLVWAWYVKLARTKWNRQIFLVQNSESFRECTLARLKRDTFLQFFQNLWLNSFLYLVSQNAKFLRKIRTHFLGKLENRMVWRQ